MLEHFHCILRWPLASSYGRYNIYSSIEEVVVEIGDQQHVENVVDSRFVGFGEISAAGGASIVVAEKTM